jgi:hypothetical protein
MGRAGTEQQIRAASLHGFWRVSRTLRLSTAEADTRGIENFDFAVLG